MPAFPLVDAHVHFWDPQRLKYAWLRNNGILERPYLPRDLDDLRGGVAIDKIIFIEAGADPAQEDEEAQWVSSLAAADRRIGAIVAAAPLEKGKDIEPLLAKLAARPLVKGIRRLLQGEKDPRYCLRDGFVEAVKLLPKYKLSFDLCITHRQLAAVIELVRKCPQVNFVLDHIAKPNIREHVLEPWKTHIKELAALPNAFCKVSGVVTEADFQTWTLGDIRPYVEHVIESFGYAKVMFGSDWPVVRKAAEYARWVAALDEIVKGAPEADRRKLYRENAAAFYRVQGMR